MKTSTGRLPNFFFLLVLLPFSMIACRALALAPNAPDNLRAFDKTNPIGTDDRPFFGWYVNDPNDNEIQTAYQILVASSQADLDANNGDLWDSGKVASSRQNYVYYDSNTPLTAATRFYWKVRTWDKDDNVSPYSTTGVFDTGLFTNANWSGAKWIKRNTSVADDFTYYRKKVTLPAKTIRRAVVYVTACHDYQLYINSNLIGKGPAYHYPQYFYYNAYDITDALTSGMENVFAALTHWYGGGQGRPGGARGFLLKAIIEYTDDTTTIIGTDASWKQRQASAWVTGQPQRNGEGVGYVTKIDARKILDNWQALSFDDSAWDAAVEIGSPPVAPWTGTLQPDLTDVVEEVITPVSVNNLGGGTYVVDFGKVYAGMPSIDFSGGTSGTTVNMRGGYTLNANGTVSTSTNQNTNMSYYFILNGGTAVFEPIVYLGMRYFQVDNSPNPLTTANVRFIKCHYEFDPSRSSFTSSDTMLNQVWEVMKHSLTVCAQEAMVDTPTREKGGFLGDSWSQGAAALITMADRSMNHRILLEFIDSQDQYWPDGRMNAVYPNGDGKRDIPDYTQMFPLWAWDYYMQTGHVEFLSDNYEKIKNIADYVDAYRDGTTGLIKNLAGGSGSYLYGIIDWPSNMRYGYDMSTAARTVINAYAWADYDVVARVADVLGDSNDRDTYRAKADAIEDAINTQLLDTNGQYIDGLLSGGAQSTHVSQHANMFPLALGIVQPNDFNAVVTAVKERQMSCGMVTVRFLCEAVGRADEGEHLLELYTNTDWDGWANNIAKGATVTWEAWDADTQGQSMSHAWGAVGLLGIVEYVVGIQPLMPQHELVQVKPLDFGNHLAHVDANIPTDRGDICVNWNRNSNHFDMTLTLPDNVEAKVYVPQLSISGTTVKVDGTNVTATKDGRYLYVENIGSGTHTFERDALKADFNIDGIVDLADYSFFSGQWMQTSCGDANDCEDTDLDFSGKVDFNDLDIFCNYWLKE